MHQLVAWTTITTSVSGWQTNAPSLYRLDGFSASKFDFMGTCPKEKGVRDADDPRNSTNHQCIIARQHCAEECSKNGTYPASIFTLNPKVNKAIKTVDCDCIYSEQ